nr:hypothetical protein [Sedimentibacter sp.]
MNKLVSLIIIINLICLTGISYAVTTLPEQHNTELTYKEAITEISEDTNKQIETVVIEDKLLTKKYNFYFDIDKNNCLDFIRLESTKEHKEIKELKAKWKSIIKVDNENKFIVDVIYAKVFPEKKVLDNYDFEMGSQGYDFNGNNKDGYYNNMYVSSIVGFRNRQNYKNYYITHYLYFSF